MASEKVVLRGRRTTAASAATWAGTSTSTPPGNLYLTTGDDTNPFESSGYSPLDERTNRNPQYDAQRSAGNTNDLRGKLLRIKPQPDGTYTIPSGNLFAPGTARTRPEIYAMGFRNPFRMSVDKATGIVYLGDYGPDAGVDQLQPGAERAGGVQPHHRSRQLRLAVLHGHQHHRRDLQRVELRHQQHRRRSTTARAARPTTPSATPA